MPIQSMTVSWNELWFIVHQKGRTAFIERSSEQIEESLSFVYGLLTKVLRLCHFVQKIMCYTKKSIAKASDRNGIIGLIQHSVLYDNQSSEMNEKTMSFLKLLKF